MEEFEVKGFSVPILNTAKVCGDKAYVDCRMIFICQYIHLFKFLPVIFSCCSFSQTIHPQGVT